MASPDILQRFCTPPVSAEENGGIPGAEVFEIPFEGETLTAYRWGAGPDVLLAHGWGSRAGHLALLARILAGAGYRVTAFDGPAHGKSRKKHSPNRSSMFEHCRALSRVAGTIGPLHAVIGHSLGAAAAAFTMAGRGHAAGHQFSAERLVLVSCPANVLRMVERFCAGAGETDRVAELAALLEDAFDFTLTDYVVSDILEDIRARLLIVHDEEDREIPVEDARGMKQARPDAELFLTKGSGHQKILVSRVMFRALQGFLTA